MEAGVVDGTRYVLPLRYDMPVIYAQDRALEEAGLDPAVLTRDLCTIMETVLETGDPLLAGGVLYEAVPGPEGFSVCVPEEAAALPLRAKILSFGTSP